jgi:thiol-disulfide isomerase/thioredoxin
MKKLSIAIALLLWSHPAWGALSPAATASIAPALATTGHWLNSPATSLQAQRGKVVMLVFWTHECINCKNTLPFWEGWWNRFHPKGNFTVLSVHTPELPEERVLSHLKQALKTEKVDFPVLTDNDQASWDRFHIQSWPTTILIDKHGRIRERTEGELDFEHSGEYRGVERDIQALLREP